jgi:hypothetical protein
MLAQNFKTADLGIKDVEFEALIKVLGMLEREELKHCVSGPNYAMEPNGFNMGDWCTRRGECGTVACIGGWVAIITEQDPRDYVKDAKGHLRELYYPPQGAKGEMLFGEIKPPQAATALRSYLSTGEANWAEALA